MKVVITSQKNVAFLGVHIGSPPHAGFDLSRSEDQGTETNGTEAFEIILELTYTGITGRLDTSRLGLYQSLGQKVVDALGRLEAADLIGAETIFEDGGVFSMIGVSFEETIAHVRTVVSETFTLRPTEYWYCRTLVGSGGSRDVLFIVTEDEDGYIISCRDHRIEDRELLLRMHVSTMAKTGYCKSAVTDADPMGNIVIRVVLSRAKSNIVASLAQLVKLFPIMPFHRQQ